MNQPRGFRPFGQTPPVFPFHRRDRKEHFLRLVRERLGRDGQRVVIRGGAAVVEGSPLVHGLVNLAQTCHQAPTAEWPRLVAEHLDKSDPERIEGAVATALGGSFAASAGDLAVRIYPADFLADGMGSHIVHRFDLPGTVTALILDIGASVLPLPTPIAAQWGVPLGTLFERAVQNLAQVCRAQWETLRWPRGGVELDVLGGDFFAAASVLRPEPFLPRIGEHGNLLAVPARDVLVSWPIDSGSSMHGIEAVLAIATGKYRDGPGSITPHVFWRTMAGQFVQQQGTIDHGKARLVPTPEFAEVLVRMQRKRP